MSTVSHTQHPSFSQIRHKLRPIFFIRLMVYGRAYLKVYLNRNTCFLISMYCKQLLKSVCEMR